MGTLKNTECPYCKTSLNVATYFRCDKMPNFLHSCKKELLSRFRLLNFEASYCKVCNLGFNSSRLDDEELTFIYDNYVYISPSNNIGHTKYEEILDVLFEYTSKDDKIVEIGCSEGYLLYKLKSNGYRNLTGIEPGPQADSISQDVIRVVKGYFDADTFGKESVDCFVMMHVFEHFPDPFAILSSIKKQLSKNGSIIIEVPNFDGYHHEHMFFYTIDFFEKMALDFDLKIIYAHVAHVLRVVMTHRDNTSHPTVSIAKQNTTNIDKLQQDFDTKIAKLNDILATKEEIYLWGAGTTSVIFLNQIDTKNQKIQKL